MTTCPCWRAVALRDAGERIAASIERTGRAPAGAVDAWARERNKLVCPCPGGIEHGETGHLHECPPLGAHGNDCA